MAEDRTEQPTPKKLKDARERGQIARSRDLAMAAASIAATMALAWLGGHVMEGLRAYLRVHLTTFGDKPLVELAAGDISRVIFEGATEVAVLVGPIALVTMTAAVGMHGFQGGWSFTPAALQWQLSRLSPAQGIKRFGLTQSGVETLKAILVGAVVTYFTWDAVNELILQSSQLAWMSPRDAAGATWHHVEDLLWRAAWTLTALALADYGYQWYKLRSSLMMTRQEVRDEHKQSEGSGEVKGKMRRLQQQMSRRRMLQDVPKATVVITNPTHYAIALEYHRETMAAPRVLAMGKDHLALKIRQKAGEFGIPIVENKPLAQALYAKAEIGQTIPAELFAAVAEVLAYLIRVKRLML